MDKIDFKKTLKPLYAPTRSQGIHSVDVPPLRFAMIDGKGDLNTSQAYSDALGALYAFSYAIKATSKRQLDIDYVVPPLEGLWWSRNWGDFAARDKDQWQWTMMIMVPDWIGPAMVDTALKTVRRKKQLPGLDRLRLELLEEGKAVQALHIGPYDDEGPLIARMHEDFMVENGFEPIGKHHEIYLSDPRKTAPQKLKTVLRQPVRQKQ